MSGNETVTLFLNGHNIVIRNYELSFSFAIILMGKRELDALLCLSPWYLVIVMWLLLAVPWVSLQIVIAVFPDHIHFLFYCQHY